MFLLALYPITHTYTKIEEVENILSAKIWTKLRILRVWGFFYSLKESKENSEFCFSNVSWGHWCYFECFCIYLYLCGTLAAPFIKK